ncbi:MAG: hypothetical protein BWX76_00971 [Candidatus Cloacimonetes bacterium ADurb.Bin089]|nr:MAG: hypothetical protein BWX76_00971 [Candidatus Cloacimonetes bacterium ADurb.Bin089]
MRKFILFLLPLLILWGCSKEGGKTDRYPIYDNVIDHSKTLAFGDDRDVYVFCDSINWQGLQPFIGSAIEQQINIVYPEKYFNLIMADSKELQKLSKYKNLLYIGQLDSDLPVSAYMKKVLSQDFIKRVENTGGDLFSGENLNCCDQIVLFLLGKDAKSLQKIGALQAENIFSLLLKRFTNRQGYYAYQGKVIDPSFFDNYPFSLKIPDTFRLYSNDKIGRFLCFLYRARLENKEIPDKYISVYYEPMPENKVDLNWLIAKRQEIGKKYFEGDEFDPEIVRKEPFKFKKRDGYRLLGAWKNMKYAIGGGFQSYGFWDKKTKTAYIVDSSVYFPAGDKLPVLLELYVISNSLEIK